MSLCEVRIPTYKRPELLKRAIESLLKQAHENWIAIVMDDSPEQEARDIVSIYHDNRIIYRPNKVHLDRSGNLDQAFQSADYVGGSYAFVLEDDNYLFPDFIRANIKSLEDNHVSIVLRNQEMGVEKNGKSVPMGKTTRGGWFFNKVYEPIELYAQLFFHTGISNGGLFWDARKITSNLQVGPEVTHQSHQEKFRCLQITDQIYFESEPLCVFTSFENRDDIAVKTPVREQRLFSRANQSQYMYLLKRYGSTVVEEATKTAERMGYRPQLERQLIDAFYIRYDFRYIKGLEFMRILTKSFLRYLMYKDPFKEHYKKKYYRY